MPAPRLDVPRIRAVLFDLDDTLINWREAEHAALGDVAGEHLTPLGVELGHAREVYAGVMEENFRAFRVNGRWWYIGERLALLAERLGVAGQVAPDLLASSFSKRVQGHLALLSGADQALTAAAQGGRRVGLLTNGPPHVQRPKVERFGLERRVHFVGISGELGHWKPDPRAFRAVCSRLGVPVEQSLMVGDHIDFDITPAKRIGMQTAWVDRGGASHPDADIVVPSVGGLVRFLDGLP